MFRTAATRDRLLIALLVILLTVTLTPPPASAQLAVYDPANWAENFQQTLSQLLGIIQRYEEIYHQIKQVEWMLEQLEGLENPTSREVASLLYWVGELMQEGEALAYSLEDLEGRFEELFRGFEAARKPDVEAREQMQAVLDTAKGVLLSTRQLGRTFVSSQQAVGRMKEQLAAAETNAELMQASGLLTAWSGEEVSKLLQQTAAMTNLLAVESAYEVNRRASAEQTFSDWLESARALDPRYDTSRAPSLVPANYPGARR